jgi:hypothetical protein
MKKSAIVNAKEKRKLKKEKNNKYPVLSDDFKSRKEVVRQLFEFTALFNAKSECFIFI